MFDSNNSDSVGEYSGVSMVTCSTLSQQLSWAQATELNFVANPQSLDSCFSLEVTFQQLCQGWTWTWVLASAWLMAAFSSTCRPLRQMEKVSVGI